MSTLGNPVNDIRKQAHQGSVAAIIQVLNEELSDLGVRTRAVFENGVLQLLCEADTPEQLAIETLPQRVKDILDQVSPRNIRRVNINSRIVREQQLLWLDEINRDPDGQLLWSKEVSLARPPLLKSFFEDFQENFSNKSRRLQTASPRQQRDQQQFLRGILGGLGVSAALLFLGVFGYYWWLGRNGSPQANAPANSSQPSASPQASAAPSASKPTQPVAAVPASPAPVSPSPSPVTSPTPSSSASPTKDKDAYAQAVDLANEATSERTTAKTSAEWQAIAEKWGKASELMAQVPSSHPRYSTAQDRISVYKTYQNVALEKASEVR